MIYFDNSATSFLKPDSVRAAVDDALTHAANPGRSGHAASFRAAGTVSAAREGLSRFVGQDNPDNCILTLNCTQALNLALLSLEHGSHVVTTVLEHNSVLRTLQAMNTRARVTVTLVEPNADGIVTAREILPKLRADTRLVAVTHVSNVTGAINDIASIGRALLGRRVKFLVDGAQSVGYLPVNMRADGIDMLAVAPHKGLHAPQGVGALIVNDSVALEPFYYGGTGTDSVSLFQPRTIPDGLESGTLPTPAIAGLGAAVEWTQRHAQEIQTTLSRLSTTLFDRIRHVPNIHLYSRDNPIGICSFNLADKSSESVANRLNTDYSICVRAGLHCAPLAHRFLNTVSSGTVRISLGIDNTDDELDTLIRALTEIAHD